MFWLRATLLSLIFFIGHAGMIHAQQPPKLDVISPQEINVEGTLLCDEANQLVSILELQEQDFRLAAVQFQMLNQISNEIGEPVCAFIQRGSFIKVDVDLQSYNVWDPNMEKKHDVYIVHVRYISQNNKPASGVIFMDIRFFDISGA